MKNTILRIALCVIAGIFSCVNSTVAQATEKIHRIEYFFDTDPGFGNATTVNVIPAVTTITDFNFTPDLTSLTRGLHRLYVRTLDSAYRWSNTTTKLFYKETLLSNLVPNVVAAEYFFETDPGFGNGTQAAVTAGQTVSFPINGNMVALSRGLHNLFIRVKDASGNWSHTVQQVFYKEFTLNNPAPNVVAAEYFFDADPGFGNGLAATVSAGQVVNFNISGNMVALTRGLHQLYVRTKDANGKWGLTTSQLFYKEFTVNNPVPNVVAAEYFFDTDPGFGNAISAPVTAGQTVTFNFSGNITALSNGLHQLYVRTKDANGKWGITTPQLFYKEALINNPVPNIIAAEYFFDTDPGFGNAIATTVTAGQDVTFNFSGNITALTNGLHRLFVRTKDINGKWSHSTPQLFYKEPVINNPVPNIVAAEYYIDSDPGFGNATAFTVSPQGQTIIQAVNIPATGFVRGLHRMYTRVKDANGKWSQTNTLLFYYETIMPAEPATDLLTLEWFWNTDPGFGNANKVTLPAGNNGQLTNFIFSVNVNGFTNTKQNLYLRVLDTDWSLTTVRMIDFTGIVVPVTLLEFTAQAQQNKVLTKWTTSQESNSSYFDVEHSSDGIHFIKFGSIPAQGNSNVNTDYQLPHLDPVEGINYYRLKQVDRDGSFKYGPVVKIVFVGTKGNIVMYPNPVSDKLNILIPATMVNNEGLVAQLFDSKGAIVLQNVITGRRHEMDVAKFASGNYVLVIKQKSGVTISQQNIIKL